MDSESVDVAAFPLMLLNHFGAMLYLFQGESVGLDHAGAMMNGVSDFAQNERNASSSALLWMGVVFPNSRCGVLRLSTLPAPSTQWVGASPRFRVGIVNATFVKVRSAEKLFHSYLNGMPGNMM